MQPIYGFGRYEVDTGKQVRSRLPDPSASFYNNQVGSRQITLLLRVYATAYITCITGIRIRCYSSFLGEFLFCVIFRHTPIIMCCIVCTLCWFPAHSASARPI